MNHIIEALQFHRRAEFDTPDLLPLDKGMISSAKMILLDLYQQILEADTSDEQEEIHLKGENITAILEDIFKERMEKIVGMAIAQATGDYTQNLSSCSEDENQFFEELISRMKGYLEKGVKA